MKLKGDLEQTMTHAYDGMEDFYWAMGLHLFPGVGMRGSVLSPARSPHWTQPGISFESCTLLNTSGHQVTPAYFVQGLLDDSFNEFKVRTNRLERVPESYMY